ncbi:MAG TPA: hypothetical protein VMZ31_02395 [Phycisphaerae bacterium]|nr:hypothetical protein [Phycisphaerae bacterium]
MRQNGWMLTATVLALSLATVPGAVAQTSGGSAAGAGNAFLLNNATNNIQGGAIGARRPGLWVQRGIVLHSNPGSLADAADPVEPDLLDLLLGATSTEGLMGLLTGQEEAGGGIGHSLLLTAIDIFYNDILDPLLRDFLANLGGDVLPRQATDPSPVNLATDVSVVTLLRWSNGGGATSFDVYLGTDSDLRQEDRIASNQAGTSVDPGELSPGTEYFWRVDSKNSAGTTRGVVWSFVTESATPSATDGES